MALQFTFIVIYLIYYLYIIYTHYKYIQHTYIHAHILGIYVCVYQAMSFTEYAHIYKYIY